MATETTPDGHDEPLFHQLDRYNWDDDQEFQGGLQAILGSVQDAQQVEHLTLRAKCYYFARKAGQPVDFDGYKRWVESGKTMNTSGTREAGDSLEPADVPSQATQNTADGGMGDAPKPASFAEICDLIAEGKPIPGIKDIPDTILEGQASERQAEARKKPWEKVAVSADEKPSWMT
jgi:hypothetical protein